MLPDTLLSYLKLTYTYRNGKMCGRHSHTVVTPNRTCRPCCNLGKSGKMAKKWILKYKEPIIANMASRRHFFSLNKGGCKNRTSFQLQKYVNNQPFQLFPLYMLTVNYFLKAFGGSRKSSAQLLLDGCLSTQACLGLMLAVHSKIQEIPKSLVVWAINIYILKTDNSTHWRFQNNI